MSSLNIAHRPVVATLSRIAVATLLLASVRIPSSPAGQDPAVLARQAAQYQIDAPKGVLDLQPFREGESAIAEGPGGRRGVATLTNVSPRINAWFVLTLDWGERGTAAYHLENPDPAAQTLRLGPAGVPGVELSSAGKTSLCQLWSGDGPTPLETARRSAQPYAPLCGGRLYLRNQVRGYETKIERATDFLRDHVWGGDAIVGVVKDKLYRDRFLDTGAAATPLAPTVPRSGADAPQSAAPRTAAVQVAAEPPVLPDRLGIQLEQPVAALQPGSWYAIRNFPGGYISFVRPRDIAPDVLRANRGAVNELDEVESKALAYLIAFDLSNFDLGFALGTDHPRVGWSERVINAVRDESLPGPDGIGTIAPLVVNGIVAPALAGRTAATFTGGFKRQHGAFRYGAFAERNHGTHYGFIEQGAVLSKLQPGLSTLYVLDDGTVGMKTWTAQDDTLLARIKFARQNGVPLVEYDPRTGKPVAGALVTRWGPGNWSGSADEKLRSLRAGICLQETDTKRFLVYGYFSTATPSAMALVFQAYGCRYAMHLDMNALEHTDLAVYLPNGTPADAQHLIRGMEEVDKKSGGRTLARFLEVPDDRDFFYLVRKDRHE